MQVTHEYFLNCISLQRGQRRTKIKWQEVGALLQSIGFTLASWLPKPALQVQPNGVHMR